MYVENQQLEPDMEQLNWFKIGKGIQQDCILPHCLFNVYAEYIMENARLDEVKAGIKIAEISVTSERQMIPPLMAESEEELKSLLMKVKNESEKVGLKPNIQKIEIIASGPITSWLDG